MKTATAFEQQLVDMLQEPLAHAGYRIVQLRLMEGKGRKTLQLVMERRDDVPMTVQDCETISSTVSALLDVADPIESAYDLEVGSPGLERPLTIIEDFERFNGYLIQVEMLMPVEGRKRHKGVIQQVASGMVQIENEGKTVQLPFVQMKTARLVATEAIIRQLLGQGEARQAPKQKKKPGKDHKKSRAVSQ